MLTQGDIAARLGVAQSTVGRWEAGLKEPDLETIQRIAALFGWRPEYVAFGTEPKEASPPPPVIRGEQQVPFTPAPPGHAKKHRGA